ncbi:MAG: sigma-70 family RNA polymerase sigma factor [Spirochaetaceae bacterium]|jgi:RNA polymerase sigma-70 factor (ECF subfamily)|nr:sigma-70 family RNA polymerase sigma factor [Spirochaetaceae bacterium]
MVDDIRGWYVRYGPMVIRRCRAVLRNEEEALDAAQDVFVNLLTAGKRLHGRFPSSLLYTMATNVCLNRLRRGRVHGLDSDETGDEVPFIDRGFERVEGKLLMEAILRDESELDRTVCYMYYADGMTLKEIGGAVDLSVSGVRKRLLAFKERTRRKLGENPYGGNP